MLSPALAVGQSCLGDCNGDREVRVSELIRGVSIALGRSQLASCPAFDDGTGTVRIGSLVLAVRRALDGCPSVPTPTPDEPTPVPTPTTTTRVFYGDLHVHSTLSLPDLSSGISTPEEAFATARDDIGLDFMAITDHDSFLTQEEWDSIPPMTRRANDPGTFVAFLGVEWTHRWHMNVQFLGDDEQFCDCIEGFQFNDAYRELIGARRAAGHVNHPKALFLPDWSMVDDTLVTNVEVWNAATNEQELGFSGALWALRAGFRFGLIGASDDHRTETAAFIGRGIAGCHAAELTRQSLIGALHERRCFATTGERIVVDMVVNGTPMGGVLAAALGTEVQVQVQVDATDAPLTVELVKNGDVVDQTTCDEVDCTMRSEVVVRDPNTFVYARILQSDGGRAWSSPVWINGSCFADDLCIQGRLAPGGDSGSDDCLAEFLFPEDGSVSGYDVDTGEVVCTDGDVACDIGSTPSECLVELGFCFRVNDSRLPECRPTRADAFEVVSPGADARRLSLDWENRGALNAIFQAAHTAPDKPRCSPLSMVRVPAGETKVFEVETRAGSRTDRDRLTVECVPR